MFIEEFIIKGYRLMDTSIIQSLVWTPKSGLTVIMGGNGSGKSSLLKEMNPLPANKNVFLDGGLKRFVCIYNDVRYILTSDFSIGNKHSFKRVIDGVEEELNESATITIQKELVERILRYDNRTHLLLTGQLLFTDLSFPNRKELLMDISDLQLDYANNVYDKSRALLRDEQGVLKHLIQKAQTMETKLANIEVNEDQSTIDNLEDTVSRLLPFKGNNHIDPEVLWISIEEINKSIEYNLNEWTKWDNKLRIRTGDNIRNVDDLNQFIGGIESDLKNTTIKIKELTQQSIDFSNIMDQLDSESLSKEELELKVKQVELDISKYKGEYLIYENWDTNQEDVLKMKDMVFNSWPDEVNIFNKEEINLIKNDFENKRNHLYNGRQRLSQLTDRLQHLENDSKGIICPKCAVSLTATGLDINETMDKLSKQIAVVNERLVIAENEFNESGLKHNEVEIYLHFINRLKEIKGMFSHLGYFWNSYFTDWDSVIKNPNGWEKQILSYCIYNNKCNDYYTLKKELDRYSAVLEQYKLLGIDVGGSYFDIKQSLHNEMEKKERLTEELGYYCVFKNNYIVHYNNLKRCETLLDKLNTTINEWIESSIQSDARYRINTIYDKLSSIKHLVQQKESLTNSIADTIAEIQETKIKIKDLEILTNILSPNKGIIADQMLGFINSYIDEMNKVISEVWSHDLTLSEWSMDSGNLDYRFPLFKEGMHIPDIAFCSNGQKEIINLAFTLVLREYLKITDYPMFLDEPGVGMDTFHKTELLKFIKNLIESNQCQQLFMINHYADWHGGLSNHDVVVLDKRNIVVPNSYNQSIVFNEY